MGLTKEQEEFYRQTLESAREQILKIQKQMEEEVEAFKKKMAELQKQKEALRQIYDGAAAILGVPNEFEEEEGEEGE